MTHGRTGQQEWPWRDDMVIGYWTGMIVGVDQGGIFLAVQGFL